MPSGLSNREQAKTWPPSIPTGLPKSFAALAYARLLQGQKEQAVAAAEGALASSKIVKIRFLAARIFTAAGRVGRAQALAADLASEVQLEPQADAKLIEGEIAFAMGDPRKAVKSFTEADNSTVASNGVAKHYRCF